MSIVDDIILCGEKWAPLGERRPDAEDIVRIFKTARAQDVPTLADAKKSLSKLSNGIYMYGKTTNPKHWCGIFACCVWNEVGLDVRWDLKDGKIKGDVKRFVGRDGLRPGDIAIVQKHAHHFIVKEVNTSDGSLLAIEGNTDGQRIRRNSRKSISEVVAFYRPAVLVS